MFQHRNYRADMARERGKTLRDALLITDVDKNGGKNRDNAGVVCRNEQAGLGHEGKEADRLQRDRFSARVRPGNEQDAEVRAEFDIDRDNVRRVQQRMASATERDAVSWVTVWI